MYFILFKSVAFNYHQINFKRQNWLVFNTNSIYFVENSLPMLNATFIHFLSQSIKVACISVRSHEQNSQPRASGKDERKQLMIIELLESNVFIFLLLFCIFFLLFSSVLICVWELVRGKWLEWKEEALNGLLLGKKGLWRRKETYEIDFLSVSLFLHSIPSFALKK